MKKNPPMTNSTASARALERRRLLADNEADWKEAGKSGIREGEPGYDDQPPIQRIMKRAETLRAQDQEASRPPMRSAGGDTRARLFERIAENGSGTMRKTTEPNMRATKTTAPVMRMNKRKDDLYKPD